MWIGDCCYPLAGIIYNNTNFFLLPHDPYSILTTVLQYSVAIPVCPLQFLSVPVSTGLATAEGSAHRLHQSCRSLFFAVPAGKRRIPALRQDRWLVTGYKFPWCTKHESELRVI